MPDVPLHIQGLEALLKKITSLQELRYVKAGLMEAAAHIKGKLATYPPVVRLTRFEVYGRTFESDAQRRAIFYKVGKKDIPYRRGKSSGSQQFKDRWTYQTQNAGLTIVIGNNTRYGPLVMGEESQTRYAAKQGWPTTRAVVEANKDEVIRYLEVYLDQTLNE